MKTLKEIQQEYIRDLTDLYDVGEVKQLFLMALSDACGITPSQFLGEPERRLDPTQGAVLGDVLSRLKSGEPLQHILGKADFYGMVFDVSPDTLIPRPETEELVDRILRDHRGKAGLKVVDIGTGSGCIAAALAHHLEAARMMAIDISGEALQVARRNARRYSLQIDFICADILEWDILFPYRQGFDVIVSNPPYITPSEKEAMHANVLRFEPHQALFVEDSAPLLFYDHIADFARAHLQPSGILYFEINQYLGQETADLLRKKGFRDVRVVQDINGADRMIAAQGF